MNDPAPALIWCPFASEDDAAMAAGALLDEGLIACANILGPLLSLYQWRGERGEARETGALMKTNAALLPRAIARLEELHPYEAPAITGWITDGAGQATAAWLGSLAGGD